VITSRSPFSLANSNSIVFMQIIHYFLTAYSQTISHFFRSQVKHLNSGIDVLAQIKPITEGGAPNFLSLVLQVFSLSFSYEAPLSVTQFFDVGSRLPDSLVALKSQLVIDILTCGLAFQSQYQQPTTQPEVDPSLVSNSDPMNTKHLVSIQDLLKGEDELMTRGQVNDTPAFMRHHNTHDSTPRQHHKQVLHVNVPGSIDGTTAPYRDLVRPSDPFEAHIVSDDSNGGG